MVRNPAAGLTAARRARARRAGHRPVGRRRRCRRRPRPLPPAGAVPASRTADTRNVTASTRYTTGMSATASSTPAMAGPAKKPSPSIVDDTTLALVSSRGSRAMLREQSGLGRPERQRQDGGEEAGAVDRGGRGVGGDQDRPGCHDGGAAEVGPDHHVPPGEAVGERREQRPEHGHHEVAGHAEHADGRRPAVLVGPDGDGDRVGPVADDGRGVGEVDAAQRGVGEHRRERPPGRAHLGADRPHVPLPLARGPPPRWVAR